LLKAPDLDERVGPRDRRGHALLQAEAADVVLFYDEIDMAPGRFRMKTGGGAAGHNGVRSTIAAVGPSFDAPGWAWAPGHKDLVHGYVLNAFAKAEQPWVEALLGAAADALPFLAAGDDERYQAEVMRLAPAPKADPRRRPSAGD
jgi:PTH1 family peptidyl-tRNA hydrolase